MGMFANLREKAASIQHIHAAAATALLSASVFVSNLEISAEASKFTPFTPDYAPLGFEPGEANLAVGIMAAAPIVGAVTAIAAAQYSKWKAEARQQLPSAYAMMTDEQFTSAVAALGEGNRKALFEENPHIVERLDQIEAEAGAAMAMRP